MSQLGAGTCQGVAGGRPRHPGWKNTYNLYNSLELILQLIVKTYTTHTTHRGERISSIKILSRDELHELYVFFNELWDEL